MIIISSEILIVSRLIKINVIFIVFFISLLVVISCCICFRDVDGIIQVSQEGEAKTDCEPNGSTSGCANRDTKDPKKDIQTARK